MKIYTVEIGIDDEEDPFCLFTKDKSNEKLYPVMVIRAKKRKLTLIRKVKDKLNQVFY